MKLQSKFSEKKNFLLFPPLLCLFLLFSSLTISLSYHTLQNFLHSFLFLMSLFSVHLSPTFLLSLISLMPLSFLISLPRFVSLLLILSSHSTFKHFQLLFFHKHVRPLTYDLITHQNLKFGPQTRLEQLSV